MLRFVYFVGVLGLATSYSIPRFHLDEPNIPEGEKEPQHWINIAQDTINRRINMKINENQAKNVILFVGDGMGPSSVTAGRILRGQVNGKPGEETVLNWERFPNVALSKTYNIDRLGADSAGTATAILSGSKANFLQIGLNGKVSVDDCEASQDNTVTSILDWSLDAGKKVGIVTTSRITHATPAATYAHVANRNWEGDVNTADVVDKGCKDIARQLVEDNPDISVIFGGGRRVFLPNTVNDPETGEINSKQRKDGRDLVKMWEDDKKRRNATYKYAWNKDGFDDIDPTRHDFALGLFEPSHMNYDIDRDKSGPTGEPSLAEMTRKAIQMLKKKEDGFFLLVEGARIDHAHHFNLPIKALFDVLALEDAVQVGLDLTDESDTLIVVTADHDHTMGIQGYTLRGSDLFGEVTYFPSHEPALDDKPVSVLVYENGPGYDTPRELLDDDKLHDKEFAYPSSLPIVESTHDATDVAIYARGPMAHLVYGVQEQSTIAHVMAYAACLEWYAGNCTRSDAHYTSSSEQLGILQMLVPMTILAHIVLN